MSFEKDFSEYLKISVISFLIGIIPAIILSAILTAFGSATWIIYFVFAVILLWSLYHLPKEVDTFYEFLVVAFMMMGITGLVTMVIPTFGQYIGWVSIISLNTFLSMIVTASLALAIANKQGWI